MKRYLIRSSKGDRDYIVTLNHAGGAQHCQCEGWKNRMACRHAREVEANPHMYKEVVEDEPHSWARPLPMLAKPLPSDLDFTRGGLTVEEKYDGVRSMARIHDSVLVDAWSRTGIATEAPKKFSAAMRQELSTFPNCVLDGELVNPQGGRSYRVTHLQPGLKFIVFDIVELLGHDVTKDPLHKRREYLEEIFSRMGGTHILLAPSYKVNTQDELDHIVQRIWDAGGEGIVVKRDVVYSPGKRTDAFMKLKECRSAVLTVVGFASSQGEVFDRGDFATAIIRDDDGNHTVVKTLDDAEIARLEKAYAAAGRPQLLVQDFRLPSVKTVRGHVGHPWIGRRLCIEYHERTPDGSYRHPRWDRWENE